MKIIDSAVNARLSEESINGVSINFDSRRNVINFLFEETSTEVGSRSLTFAPIFINFEVKKVKWFG